MCSNTGTPNIHHFPFGTHGKVVVLGVPILKHFRVYKYLYPENLFSHNILYVAEVETQNDNDMCEPTLFPGKCSVILYFTVKMHSLNCAPDKKG